MHQPSSTPDAKERLAKDMASEIVLSQKPSETLRKWRSIFKVSQKKLAAVMGITPSVISDYESGRRKSPGIGLVRRYINALLDVDATRERGVAAMFDLPASPHGSSEAIIDIREFSAGVEIDDFCKLLHTDMITPVKSGHPPQQIYGYTVIDSVKAITEASFQDLLKVYGATSKRALVFTKVSTGRSPMVAIKVSNIKPALVVLHGLGTVDDIAKRIAEAEGIPLAVCRLEKVENIVAALKSLHNK
ncbi:MAG: helix-turn-helix domain-containing protein [Candidatus Aenigmarchaeota archaeon]|nr:helix-turn-helix domain-containing protein [Candidatus Aenigmarchaeota archaeon]